MTPTKFIGSNVVIAENQPPYLPLPARLFKDKEGTILTCWELTEEDLAEITRTKAIWVTMLTFNQLIQPIMLSSNKPKWDLEHAPELAPEQARIWGVQKEESHLLTVTSELVLVHSTHQEALDYAELANKACNPDKHYFRVVKIADGER